MRRPVNAVAALLVTASALSATGCGETYDLADLESQPAGTVAEDSGATSANGPLAFGEPSADTPTDLLLDDLLTTWRDLDEYAIVGDPQRLERILAIWSILEERVITERPDLHFGFSQAIDLAITSVERRRPGDAGKGLRIAIEVSNSYSDGNSQTSND